MKKTIIFILMLSLTFYSCKKEKEAKSKIPSVQYTIDTKNTVVKWTAYKTTDKVPVKGIFKKIEISNINMADNPAETIKDVKFSIPVNSIFSNDSIRDFKLSTFLFGKMVNTTKITGKITLNSNGKGEAEITMNGLNKNQPVDYEVTGDKIKVNTVIDLNNWQAQAALVALNEVCSEKHKSADGKSVTWSEVAIEVEIQTVKK